MNLIGLIDTTAQTLAVVRKNSQPSDKIAANFLKQKRSLGSNDRRFVLDLLFFILRNHSLFEYLTEEVSKSELYLKIPLDLSKNENGKAKTLDSLTILIAIAVVLNSNHFKNELNLEIYVNKKEISGYDSFDKLFSQNLTTYSNWTELEILNWIDYLINLLELIFNSSNNEINNFNNYETSNLKYSYIRYSIPEWIVKELLINTSLDINNIFKLAQSFTKSAPITLRINDRQLNMQQIIEELNNGDISLTKGTLSPLAYHLSKRIYLSEHPLYKAGAIEIQDEASQLVSFSIAPEKSWNVLDACAGAGGKSLHLAYLQNDEGNIVALDNEFARLKEIPKRAQNGGFRSINTYLVNKNNEPQIKDGNIKFFNKRSFNAILIDAPCSGMGTLRREPLKKFRTTSRLVEKLSGLQFNILNHYSQYLKIGGVLVYATCSIMPQENDLVVARFLEENPDFAPDPLTPAFGKYGITIPDLNPEDFKYTFYTHLYGTDGFFVARMKKIE